MTQYQYIERIKEAMGVEELNSLQELELINIYAAIYDEGHEE